MYTIDRPIVGQDGHVEVHADLPNRFSSASMARARHRAGRGLFWDDSVP